MKQFTGKHTMDKSHLAELKDQYRRAQGSVNYWTNAARTARKGAEKHTGQRQAQERKRLAEYETKAVAAAQQLQHIKDQLTELDPQGARARQNNALRTAIARANRDIAHLQGLANLPGQEPKTVEHYEAKLNARRAKLAQLVSALTEQQADAERAARDQRLHADLLATVNAAYSYDPHDPAELEKLDARQRGHMVNTDLDRHTPARPRRTTH